MKGLCVSIDIIIVRHRNLYLTVTASADFPPNHPVGLTLLYIPSHPVCHPDYSKALMLLIRCIRLHALRRRCYSKRLSTGGHGYLVGWGLLRLSNALG